MTPENTVLAQHKTILTKIAITQIWPNPKNPRSVYSPEDIQNLAANLKASGQRSPVKVVALTEAEKIELDYKYEYKLLGGHMRREAALTLGWDSLDALILNLTPDEAELEMILDNRVIDLPWLDQYKIIESYKAKHPTLTQEALGARLGVDQVTISRALKTLKALNPASRELLYSAGIKNDGYKRVTQALAALEDSNQIEKALRVALDLKLNESQAKELVQWIQAGNPSETFRAVKAPRAKSGPKPKGASASPRDVEAASASHPQVDHPSTHHPTPPRETTSPQAKGTSTSTGSQQPNSSAQMGAGESVLWEAAVGVSIVSRIKAKIKKGERPNLFEVLILAVHTLWVGLAWVAKQVWKLAKPVAKVLWKLLKDGLKLTLKALGRTVYNLVRVVLALAVLGLLGWFAWEFLKNGHHPRAALMEIGKTLWQWVVMLWRQG